MPILYLLKMNRVTVRTYVNGNSGYGQVANQIVCGLKKHGYDSKVIPIRKGFNTENVPQEVLSRIIPNHLRDSELDLVVCPMNFHISGDPVVFQYAPAERRIHLTMWEASQIRFSWANRLNENDAVIVPSHWNKEVFTKGGVEVPVYIVRQSVNSDLYHYVPPKNREYFVFGCGGYVGDGASKSRKRVEDTIRAFVKAFPSEKNVRLKVKVADAQDFPRFTDSRIEIEKRVLTDRQMFEWYQDIDVFASMSACEGWGLMHHQAMATGRPVIAACFGGLTEFFDSSVGFPVDYDLVPATHDYASADGEWAAVDLGSFTSAMRQCYAEKDEVIQKGKLASAAALKFDHNHMLAELTDVLNMYS